MPRSVEFIRGNTLSGRALQQWWYEQLHRVSRREVQLCSRKRKLYLVVTSAFIHPRTVLCAIGVLMVIQVLVMCMSVFSVLLGDSVKQLH